MQHEVSVKRRKAKEKERTKGKDRVEKVIGTRVVKEIGAKAKEIGQRRKRVRWRRTGQRRWNKRRRQI